MKRLAITSFLLIALLFGGVANAADLQKGVDAYHNSDYKTALQELEPLAKEGVAEAKYYLGTLHLYGDGVPKNPKKALKWFRHAAKQNHALAQNSIAFMFSEGLGLPNDNINALMWYIIAAKTGYETESDYKNGLREKSKARARLNKDEIAIAKKRAKKCIKSNYKKCSFKKSKESEPDYG